MPRRLAFDILKKSEKSRQFSNIALDSALSSCSLERADRALATALVLGVIERRITLDYYIDRLAKNSERIDTDTRILLRLGLYQLMFMDKIPSYAAVNETVSIAPKRSVGYVNAVLREYSRRGKDILLPQKENGTDAYLSVKYSFPEGLCKKFTDIYGTERTENIFEAFNSAPPLSLRVNTLKISVDEYLSRLSESVVDVKKSEIVPDGMIVRGASPTELYGFGEGLFFVQDIASQICVEALGATAGETVIDACSCPGSKAFGSAIRMKNKGKISAFDLHKSKLSLINSGAQRLGIDIITADTQDGRNLREELVGQADRVLCDVPCSGFGVIGKKPEIRYKDLSEAERLPEIQLAILENCSRYVRKGGILVYSTCTVFPEENEGNIERFLERHLDFSPCDFEVGGLVSENGCLSLSPDRHGTDGFFIAKMKKG